MLDRRRFLRHGLLACAGVGVLPACAHAAVRALPSGPARFRLLLRPGWMARVDANQLVGRVNEGSFLGYAPGTVLLRGFERDGIMDGNFCPRTAAIAFIHDPGLRDLDVDRYPAADFGPLIADVGYWIVVPG